MYSRNIKVGDKYEGRRCNRHKQAGTAKWKCEIENHIFSKMNEFALYCCNEFWRLWLVKADGKNQCPTAQLAYHLWLPGDLTILLNFNRKDEYKNRLNAHLLRHFDPSQRPVQDSAQMCNCHIDAYDPNVSKAKLCRRQKQPHEFHPHLNDINAGQMQWPLMAWPSYAGTLF